METTKQKHDRWQKLLTHLRQHGLHGDPDQFLWKPTGNARRDIRLDERLVAYACRMRPALLPHARFRLSCYRLALLWVVTNMEEKLSGPGTEQLAPWLWNAVAASVVWAAIVMVSLWRLSRLLTSNKAPCGWICTN